MQVRCLPIAPEFNKGNKVNAQQLETASRLVCQKRGIDPDAGRMLKQWELVSSEVKRIYEVIESIDQVINGEDQ